MVLSWHPKLCSNRTKPILLQSQQDTELGGLTDCFQNTQKSSTFSRVLDSMGLFSFNPVDPTEVSLRGFVSEHSKRRVPHSLRYVRLDSSHSTQWLPQKSVSEDLFQSTAEEEFHILRYKTQWVFCFFPFNNLMNLIELLENCISVTIPFPSLCLLLRFAGLCFFLFLLFTCFQFTVLAAATDTKADTNDRWSSQMILQRLLSLLDLQTTELSLLGSLQKDRRKGREWQLQHF